MKLLILLIALLAPVSCFAATVGDDPPPSYDILMLAGEDYQLLLTMANNHQPIDLTGNTYVMQFRSAPNGTLFASYSANAVIPASSGQISGRLSKAQTTKLIGKTGVWDLLQRTAAGLVSYIMTGKCSVQPTVSKLP
jgi:hypothetical protein